MKIFLLSILPLFCFVSASHVSAQQEKEDSLEFVFLHHSNDSLRLDAMLEYLNVTYNKYPEKAKKIANDAIKLAQKRKSSKMEAGGNLILGMISFSESQYEQSVKYYLKSLEGYLKSKTPGIGVSSAYNNLGLVYSVQDNIDKALECYEKSLEYIDTSNFVGKDSYYATLLNIGVIYGKKNEFTIAKEYVLKVAQFYEKTDDFLSLAYTYQTMGIIAGEEKNIKLIDEYFEKALNSVSKKDVPPYTVSVLNGAASTYSKANNHKKALYYALKADSVINKYKLSDLYDIKNTKAVIAHSNYILGNYKFAYEVLEERIKISDSLYSIETSKSTRELIEKYESEKKEKEIALLKEKDNVNQLEITHRDDRLKIRAYFIAVLSLLVLLLIIVSVFIYRQIQFKQQKQSVELEHKALRAQMNPHFIFNALNSIQRMYLEGNLDKASSFMSDFAELMRKILENSSHYTIPLKEEIKTLEYYLKLEKLRCQDKFTYTITIDPTIDAEATHVPPLIIQPFVENAIWHGILPKEGFGHISIAVSKAKDRLKIEVQDNGIGIKEKKQNPHHSKGIHITEQRIGSKVIIESIENEKTSITFYLKMEQ